MKFLVVALLPALAISAAPPFEELEARSVPVSTIPHITMGGNWKTTVRIPNVTKLFQEVRLETYTRSGAGMEVQINGQMAYSRTLAIPPLGVLDVELTKEGESADGYAHLLFLGGSSLPHTVLYSMSGVTRGAMGKVAGASYAAEYFQFDNTDDAESGVAFLVPFSSSEILHRLTCYAANGSILGSFSYPVPGVKIVPQGGFQKILLATPGNLSSTTDLKGTCHFSYSSPSAMTDKVAARPVVSLRFLRDTFLPLTF